MYLGFGCDSVFFFVAGGGGVGLFLSLYLMREVREGLCDVA